MGRVLVACEFSGVVRDAFIARGHDAISCDLLPTESPGPHIVGDVRPLLRERWDLVIAHPPCTYLSNVGLPWLSSRPERWEMMEESAQFFKLFFDANSPFIAIENPRMHRHSMKLVGRKYNFLTHAWQFGHENTKIHCWWLKGLPPLLPTAIMQKRVSTHNDHIPHPDRWKLRSRFFSGIAAAMADQWGRLLPDQQFWHLTSIPLACKL